MKSVAEFLIEEFKRRYGEELNAGDPDTKRKFASVKKRLFGKRNAWVRAEAERLLAQGFSCQEVLYEAPARYLAAVLARSEARAISRALNKPATGSQPKGGRL